MDAAPPGLTLIAILTVRPGATAAFRAFEARAAAIIAGHGGAIERVIVIPPATADAPLREVHVVTFPDAAALAAYRADPALAALAADRAAAIAATEVLIGHDAPPYR